MRYYYYYYVHVKPYERLVSLSPPPPKVFVRLNYRREYLYFDGFNNFRESFFVLSPLQDRNHNVAK